MKPRATAPGAAALAVGAALAGAWLWWRRNPSACPYGQRFWVQLPRPFLTRGRLREIMQPAPGERVLDIGVGTGYYALDVARWVAPDGVVAALDLQSKMVDHVVRRAAELGIENLEPRVADARSLPYAGDRFDCAYLVTVLGEIPDQDAALSELARVLCPGGRLIVGEIAGDPHMVGFDALCRRAEAAGFRFDRRLGGRLAYYARFAA